MKARNRNGSSPLNEQLNFFTMQDEFNEKERDFLKKTENYQKWLSIPERTLIKEDTLERENLNDILWGNYCRIYMHAYHECPNIADDEYIWLNPCSWNYWVLNKKKGSEGEKVDVCPYCGAQLGKGKGDAILYRAEPKYWLFYLHFDVPMHDLGYQPLKDKLEIKKVWG